MTEHDNMPPSDASDLCLEHERRLTAGDRRFEEQGRDISDIKRVLGRPPDPSTSTDGTGMAGTLAQVAVDVKAMKGAKL